MFLLKLPVLYAALAALDSFSFGDVDPPTDERTPLDPSFLDHCAFVSVDIQEGVRPAPVTLDRLPAMWREMGFTAEDVNAANAFAWEVALPNAVKVTEACRAIGLPMVFVHWGYLFSDGMDLEPDIRNAMLKEHGTDYPSWGGYIAQPGSQPAKALGVRAGEYVIPKAGQDAFRSSNIGFVLRNLGVKNIVFVGGHTGACLGKTAESAKRLGYRTLCVRDATNSARASTREKEIQETGYDYVVSTGEFVALARTHATEEECASQPAPLMPATPCAEARETDSQ